MLQNVFLRHDNIEWSITQVYTLKLLESASTTAIAATIGIKPFVYLKLKTL